MGPILSFIAHSIIIHKYEFIISSNEKKTIVGRITSHHFYLSGFFVVIRFVYTESCMPLRVESSRAKGG